MAHKIEWSPLRYGFTRASVGHFDLSAGWDIGAYIAEVDGMIRVKGLPSLEAAKARALLELRKALTDGLARIDADAKEGA